MACCLGNVCICGTKGSSHRTARIPEKHVTGRMVADRLHIGYESFRKKFKSLYHISPNAYRLNYRINYAKALLSDEHKTLEEIAALCGFSDGFAFSKAFKKRCGISTEQFRRGIKKIPMGSISWSGCVTLSALVICIDIARNTQVRYKA